MEPIPPTPPRMPPIIDDPVPTIPPVVPHDALCRQCGYRIGTLPRDHNCPECGTPIERSLRGDLLLYSSTEYASSLQRGLTCILIAVVIQIAAGLVSFIAVLIFVWRPLMRQQSDPDAEARIFSLLQQLQLGSQILMLPVAALSLYGWWLFSSPDPAVLGFEHGQTPRVVIRAATIIMAALVLLGVVSQSLVIANSAFTAISYGVGILVGLASIAQFFASLLYIRWLAPRIPDASITKTAGRYLWLLPLIYLLGSCILVGPLVATIMYLLLLNQVRIRLREVRELQQREFGASQFSSRDR